MLVSIFIKRISERIGGAERVAIELANELYLSGYTVELIHYENSNEPPAFPLNKNIIYKNIKSGNKFQLKHLLHMSSSLLVSLLQLNFSKIAWSFKYRLMISRLKSHYTTPDNCVIISLLPNTFPYVIEATKSLSNKKVIASTHNVPEKDFEDKSRWEKSKYDRYFRLQSLKECYRTTILMPSFQFFFKSKGITNTQIIANMICMPGSKPKHQDSTNELTFISAGRFVPHKRMHYIIQAFALLYKSNSKCRLILCGDGPELNKCKNLAASLNLQNAILFTGHTKNIASFYTQSNIFITASSYEGFGLATVEAFSYGLPAIGFSDCQGTNEIITNNHNGLLVLSGDPATNLYNGMLNLSNNSILRNTCSINAYESYLNYTPNRILPKWKSIINEAF